MLLQTAFALYVSYLVPQRGGNLGFRGGLRGGLGCGDDRGEHSQRHIGQSIHQVLPGKIEVEHRNHRVERQVAQRQVEALDDDLERCRLVSGNGGCSPKSRSRAAATSVFARPKLLCDRYSRLRARSSMARVRVSCSSICLSTSVLWVSRDVCRETCISSSFARVSAWEASDRSTVSARASSVVMRSCSATISVVRRFTSASLQAGHFTNAGGIALQGIEDLFLE